MVHDTRQPEPVAVSTDFSGIDALDEPTVCPVHLRFVPCRSCPDDLRVMSSRAEHVEAARRFHAGEHPTCGSNTCESVPAIVEGIFDPRSVNNGSPQEMFYCYRCAVLLDDWGPFTPGRALYHVPAEDLLTAFKPSVRDLVAGSRVFALVTATPA